MFCPLKSHRYSLKILILVLVPNAVAIFGRTYPPGHMRTIIFAIFGAIAPVGFLVSGAMAALLAVKAGPRWIWFFTAMFTSAVLAVAVFILPDDDLQPVSDRVRTFDYIGTLLIIMALGLFNITWNQAPITGWSEAYVWSLLLVALLSFVAFYFWEKRIGKQALIPTVVLQPASLLVYLSLWLGWMSFGVFLFYTTLL